MGYPTFTFETDDEQFLLGTIEPLSERLGEELDVMKYLIDNVWYWRARLIVESIEINGDQVDAHVVNLGRASTSNATLHYSDSSGVLLWQSPLFGVNATNETKVTLDSRNLTLIEDGVWSIHYQKRVIDASQWVEEYIDDATVEISEDKEGFLPAPSMFIHLFSILMAVFAGRRKNIDF